MLDYFTQEIIVEIFQRLPLKSLVKCMCVCKPWKSLITDHTFISNHLTRNPNNTSFFLHLGHKSEIHHHHHHSLHHSNDLNNNVVPLKCPLLHTQLVGTCNGLVCQAHYTPLNLANILIWNPSIHKYKVLPKPTKIFTVEDTNYKRYVIFIGFGFDSINNDFKVVRLMTLDNKQQETTPKVEVYSLLSNSWRIITFKSPPPKILISLHVKYRSQMFVNGKIHWVVSKLSNDGEINNFVLSFDVSKEKFGELMLPQRLKINQPPSEVSILAGGDLLAVIHTSFSSLDCKSFSIWVMKEYGVVESWSEVFHFDSARYYIGGGIESVLALRSNGEMVLKLHSGGIVTVLQDPIMLSGLIVNDLGVRECFDNVFVGSYVQSLFLIDNGRNIFFQQCE